MDSISSFVNSVVGSGAVYNKDQQTAQKADKTDSTQQTSKKSEVKGKTIGSPQLSEKAAKYYEQLKEKFSDKDFVLVSRDMKNQAQAMAGSFANANQMVVLVDEDKIEKMAEDEQYRKKYEGIIKNASNQLAQMQASMANTTATVKGFGMQVNDDGTASYFAVLEKSSAAQRERIEKKAVEKREAKKAAAKKAAKEEAEQRLEEARENNKSGTVKRTEDTPKTEDTVTITASSLEELMKKINDHVQMTMSDNVLTDQEKQVGQHIDFRG